MEGSDLAPSMNSSNVMKPSLSLSICLKILSVRFSGVGEQIVSGIGEKIKNRREGRKTENSTKNRNQSKKFRKTQKKLNS